jgi:hypothetical protein
MHNLKEVKVTAINKSNETIEFSNGIKLFSYHYTECCERHYLSLNDLTMSDFEGLEFDLTNDDFFERIEGYGIALKPTNGHPVRIPGYGSNNGYYSSDLSLILTNHNDFAREYNISECQDISI